MTQLNFLPPKALQVKNNPRPFRLVRWLKKPGASVLEGERLFVYARGIFRYTYFAPYDLDLPTALPGKNTILSLNQPLIELTSSSLPLKARFFPELGDEKLTEDKFKMKVKELDAAGEKAKVEELIAWQKRSKTEAAQASSLSWPSFLLITLSFLALLGLIIFWAIKGSEASATPDLVCSVNGIIYYGDDCQKLLDSQD